MTPAAAGTSERVVDMVDGRMDGKEGYQDEERIECNFVRMHGTGWPLAFVLVCHVT